MEYKGVLSKKGGGSFAQDWGGPRTNREYMWLVMSMFTAVFTNRVRSCRGIPGKRVFIWLPVFALFVRISPLETTDVVKKF